LPFGTIQLHYCRIGLPICDKRFRQQNFARRIGPVRCVASGEDERARACYDNLLQALAEAGYYSYRLGIQGMRQLQGSDSYNRILQTLKMALDPNGVLAPGRYLPPT